MCGFAGIVRFSSPLPGHDVLGEMVRAIAHRGPDGQRILYTPTTPRGAGAAMAFARLAVIDLDERAMQPFVIEREDGSQLTLVFNGEIYNFRDLRSQLSGERPEYAWRTQSDTEVVAVAIDTWREYACDRLDGMLAIAAWDSRDDSIFLARDPYGQKPLYYAAQDDGYVFASELPAIRASGLAMEMDSGQLPHYFRYGYVTPGASMYRGVKQLLPGWWLRASAGEVVSRQAVDLNAFDPRERLDEGAAIRKTRSLMENAVHRQMVSDVPLGVFLSGGVDSSIVAACARLRGNVRTFSIGMNDHRYDESVYARNMAAHLGTKHTLLPIDFRLTDDLPAIVRQFAEPFADSSALPTQWLSLQTRKHVTVALSGDGGDELFGGYDRYVAMDLAERYRMLSPLAGIGRSFAGGHPKSAMTRIGRLVASTALPEAKRYDSMMRLFDDTLLFQLLRERPLPPAEIEALYTRLRDGRDRVATALAVDRATYLPGDLHTKVDRCSMRYALEVRSPFMDRDLIRFAASLTQSQLIDGGKKRLLRLAFTDALPRWVWQRKKMGFAVPIGEWFHTHLSGTLRELTSGASSVTRRYLDSGIVAKLINEHQNRHVDHGQRLYAILVLELWNAQQPAL